MQPASVPSKATQTNKATSDEAVQSSAVATPKP
jgi:hypothetical protein